MKDTVLINLKTALLAKAFLQALLCLTVGVAGTGVAVAQTSTFSSIKEDFDQHRQKALQEKLFLHVDRPTYVSGETMWFKVYNVDGTLHKPLDMSKVAYVEVLDATQQPVLQGKVALERGTGKGSFVVPATLASGNYTVRAYTNWMKNFSPEFYFEQPITIVNTFTKIEAPVVAKEASAYTIQFFSEGGNMVAGLESKVAFKAVDIKTGQGINFEGELQDQKGNKVADFKPYKFGIGHFSFTPSKGEQYVAVIKMAGSKGFVQKLPQVHEQGYSLQLQELDANRVQISVRGVQQQQGQVYLLGHARQMIAVAEVAPINQGTALFTVDKNALAEGITHFTIFNSQKQPVCERLYFKRPTQILQLEAKASKAQYSTREKVALDLLAQETTGKAASANLSLAVYRLDSLQAFAANSIESYLWLTSDLKGTIENPGYYFSDAGATDREAIDNLMLTHGWSRFKWEEILAKELPTYRFVPEFDGHFIRGKVTQATTGAPAPGVVTYLAAPGRHIRMYNSESDANGFVRFETKDFLGPKEVVVQSNFTKDSTYHFEIFSPFSDKFSASKSHAFSLSQALEHSLTLRHVETQAQQAYYGSYSNRFLPSGIDSVAFYGKPDEQYKLDDFIRFKVLEEVMREYVPGVQVRTRKGKFHFMVHNRPRKFTFQNDPLVLLDGVPVFDTNKIMSFDPLKIQRLDVITSLYLNGPLTFDGVVSYATYKGDLAGFELNPRALLIEYEGLQQQREFYTPSYDTTKQKQSRLADLRNLLYWNPELITEAEGKKTVEFYTSDQVGTYLVVVQGMTKNGLAGSKAFTIRVAPAL
ncbi:hypothetical protein [Pontibacter harenae]|uniref:hypothetical protein n=1 Tax=Pontibacter harenae TaxID=2894083 RepID=UPI001E39F8DC|nr:hypothetical protein [Pontibacter harenae]MCC9167132.1 hypothetical protein [Pontibacter harenae]